MNALKQLLTLVVVLVIAPELSGCTVTPDGRRALSPIGKRIGESMIEHAIACGVPTLLGVAASLTPPDLERVSACHLDLIGRDLGRTFEKSAAGDPEHGRQVYEAAGLILERDAAEAAGRLDVARDLDERARAAAADCEATARARLGVTE